jgi:uncharacterized protein YkwD
VLPRARAALATAGVIVVACISVTAVSAAPTSHTRNVVMPLTALDGQIVERIDAERAQHGLARLDFSRRLRAAVTFHSYEMARAGFFSHTSLDGTSPPARLARFYRSAGFSHWKVAETLLWDSGTPDAESAVRDWMTSPEHRSILLDPGLRDVGISAVHASAASGTFRGAAATLVTADFGARTR